MKHGSERGRLGQQQAFKPRSLRSEKIWPSRWLAHKDNAEIMICCIISVSSVFHPWLNPPRLPIRYPVLAFLVRGDPATDSLRLLVPTPRIGPKTRGVPHLKRRLDCRHALRLTDTTVTTYRRRFGER